MTRLVAHVVKFVQQLLVCCSQNAQKSCFGFLSMACYGSSVILTHDLGIHINAESSCLVALFRDLLLQKKKAKRGLTEVVNGTVRSSVQHSSHTAGALLERLTLQQAAPKCSLKSHCEYFANSLVTSARLCEITFSTFIVEMCCYSPVGRSSVVSVRVQL